MNLAKFQQSEAAAKPHILLLGNPVSHSFSPFMHNMAARINGLDVSYHAVKLEPSELSLAAAHFNRDMFKGANVTLPHKQVLFDYVDQLDEVAKATGAINTITANDLKLVGHNTDVYGFSLPLEDYAEELEGAKAIVFGTGGASKAVIYALKQFGVKEIYLISRNPEAHGTNHYVKVKGYAAWPGLAEEAQLVINTTPLGMAPDVETSPVRESESRYLQGRICYDIVYKPQKTRFLSLAQEAGARTIEGLEMLIHQGSRSFELWTGYPFPVVEVRKQLYEKIRRAT